MLTILMALVLGQTPAPKVELPDTIKGEPFNFITILPTTNGKTVKYAFLDKGLNVFPSSLLANPIATVVTAPRGRYRLLAYTALGDVPSDPIISVIVVGDVPDNAPFGPYVPKPGPGPSPGPDPRPGPDPQPDNPDDNKPKPVDPLETALMAIWGGLSSQDKSAPTKVAKLAEVYREGARCALDTSTNPTTGGFNYATVGDVYTKINTLGKGMFNNNDIFEIRDRLRVEMNSVLPRDPRLTLDEPTRKKLAREFERYSNILEKLK